MSDQNKMDDLVFQLDLLKRALSRERKARERAEDLLDSRATTLFQINQKLLGQYEEMTKKTDVINFLNSIAGLNADKAEFKQSLELFIENVCRLCFWPVGHVYFPKEQDGQMRIESGEVSYINEFYEDKKFKLFFAKYTFSLGESIPGKVFETKSSHWVGEITIEDEPDRFEELQSLNMKFSFVVPIVVGGKVEAIIEFFSEEMTQRDQELVDVIQSGLIQFENALEKRKSEIDLQNNYEKLKMTQMQLVQSEKMASLGTIAAGIAHEINNPICFVLANTEILGDYRNSFVKIFNEQSKLNQMIKDGSDMTLKNQLEKVLEVMEKEDLDYLLNDSESLIKENVDGVLRVRDIVQGLKSFSRIDEAETKEADINECIESTLKVIWNELKYKCVLNKNFETLPKTFCHPGQLIQVFTNLLINASQAMEEKGEINITTAYREGHIYIDFEDNGKGIKEDDLKQIFTPFFTTKPAGKGTGLGLSISFGIIQKHGGQINVQSQVGKGTTFSIVLPVVEREECVA